MEKFLFGVTSCCPASVIALCESICFCIHLNCIRMSEYNFILQLQELRKAGLEAQHKLIVSCIGDDCRHMWEIPAVRNIFQRVYKRFPELMFYCREDGLAPILMCLADIATDGERKGLIAHTENNRRFLLEMNDNAADYLDNLAR